MSIINSLALLPSPSLLSSDCPNPSDDDDDGDVMMIVM